MATAAPAGAAVAVDLPREGASALLLRGGRLGAERHGDLLGAAAALDGDVHLVTRLVRGDRGHQVAAVMDRRGADLGHDVTLTQAGRGRRAAVGPLPDHGAGAGRGARIPGADAEVGVAHAL